MKKTLIRIAMTLASTGIVLTCRAAEAPPAAHSPVASEIAASVLGQDRVAREASSDSTIGAQVSASIRNDPAMAGSDVSVNADRGVVVLTGTVKTQEQAAVASAHAQRFDGVRRVDSHLATNLR